MVKLNINHNLCILKIKHGIKSLPRLTSSSSFFFFPQYISHPHSIKHLHYNDNLHPFLCSFFAAHPYKSACCSSHGHNQIKLRQLLTVESSDRPLPPWPTPFGFLDNSRPASPPTINITTNEISKIQPNPEFQTWVIQVLKSNRPNSISKDALRDEDCPWLINCTTQDYLVNVGLDSHFNMPPHVWRTNQTHGP